MCACICILTESIITPEEISVLADKRFDSYSNRRRTNVTNQTNFD